MNLLKIILSGIIYLSTIGISPAPSQAPFGGGKPFYNQRVSQIPIKMIGHKLYVEVRINNSPRPSWFILDTGAFSSLGEPLRKSLNLSQGRALRASGSIKYAFRINEPVSLQVGQVGVNEFRIVCMDYDYFYQTRVWRAF